MNKKSKVLTAKVVAPKRMPHMKYNTFVVLRAFLEGEKEKLHKEYCIATNLTYEYEYDGISAPKMVSGGLPDKVRNAMWENYRLWMRYYDDMVEQLKYAAAESNRNHPNPDMRDFWNVEH